MPMRDTRTAEQRTADAFAHADEVEPIFRQAVIGERADAFQPQDVNYERFHDASPFPFTEPAPGYEKDPSGDETFLRPVQGLPVAGYRKEQPQWAVDLVNVNKVLEEAILRQIDHLKVKYSSEVDQRDVAIAKTEIESAFTRLNRAVFRPERLADGRFSDLANSVLRAAGSRAALSVEELEAGL